MNPADLDRLVKLLGALGSEFAVERDTAALAIEWLRRRIGLTWAELLRPAPVRRPIIIPPRPARAPILTRGEAADV